MISVSQPVSRVAFAASVSGIKTNFTPLDFELRQSWGQQDMLFARTVVPKGYKYTSLLSTWAEGAPVEITWGRPPPALLKWYGYVNHSEVATSDDATGQNVQLTYVLTGTSKIMQGDRSRVWNGCTISGIAQRIARDYGLRCVVTVSSWVLPYEVQANESDFCFLNRMTSKNGFRAWVSGGTLYCVDPSAVLSGASKHTVPTYVIRKLGSIQDSARNFRVLSGDSLPGAFRMNRVIHGLDSTGQVFRVRADGPALPAGDIIESRWHVSSPAQGKQIVNAEAAMAQFWQTATVELMGLGLVYPGKVIALAGAAIPDSNQGNWLVVSASHVLRQGGIPDPTADHYVTRCTLVRNQKGYPFIKGVHPVSPEMIPCVLRGNAWQASTMSTVIEGRL